MLDVNTKKLIANHAVQEPRNIIGYQWNTLPSTFKRKRLYMGLA